MIDYIVQLINFNAAAMVWLLSLLFAFLALFCVYSDGRIISKVKEFMIYCALLCVIVGILMSMILVSAVS